MHNLLRRQLRRVLGSDEPPDELKELIAVIDGAYSEFDSDREMVERSLELASKELMERNALLRQDVETRMETEQRLTETLSVLESTLDSTADGILVVTTHPERKISRFNKQFLDMWNIPRTYAKTAQPEELIDYVIGQLADPDAFRAAIDRVYQDPQTDSFDVLLMADGRIIELASLPRRIDGVPVGRVWSFSDVTERARAAAALQQSEAYWRSLLQNAEDVIAVVGPDDFAIRYCSPAIEHMLGYAPSELEGKSAAHLMHPDDLPALAEWNTQVQNNEQHEGFTEFRMHHANGHWVNVEARAKLVSDTTEDFIVVNARDITERKRAEETIRFMAYHDSLTGLPNRDLLRDRLEQALSQARRTNDHLAVIFLDLDRLKDVNDTLGHAGGDELLRFVSDRLARVTRDGDTLARVGGDEFIFVLPYIASPQDAIAFSSRVLETLRSPVVVHGQEFRATASLGLAIFPDDGSDVDTLIRNADTAMYRAKETGRDNMQMYAASMNASVIARLTLERELLRAHEQQEFVLFYQPITDVATGQLVGVEALIRWQHPERGLVPPDEFVPITEEMGLIVHIGAWVLETACRQGAEWERMYPGFRVAVNVSARQFVEPSFVARVRDALWNSGISPDALELEVTETAAMASPERIAQALGALRSMGVRPVIDDFGTGYSSLSHLKKLPVVKLKIDRSFTNGVTSDPNDAAIAAATIAMAHSLNLTVTAEGIETQEQLDFYRAHNCDEAQGYFLGMPGPAADVTCALKAAADRTLHPATLL